MSFQLHLPLLESTRLINESNFPVGDSTLDDAWNALHNDEQPASYLDLVLGQQPFDPTSFDNLPSSESNFHSVDTLPSSESNFHSVDNLPSSESNLCHTFESSSPLVELFVGKSGGRQISYNSHLYTFDRRTAPVHKEPLIYWQCICKADLNCKARLCTSTADPPSIVKEPDHPLHGPCYDRIALARVHTNIKSRALTSDPTSTVVQDCISGVAPQVLANLPSLDSMKQSVRHKRRKANHHPVLPLSAHDFVIPEEYQLDSAGYRFLQEDGYTSRHKRVLVFSSDSSLDALQAPSASTGTSSGDGTFNTSPEHFTQNFVIRSKVGSVFIPVAHCLLEDKSRPSYELALGSLKRLAPLWNPAGFIVDFELAMHQAFQSVFPNAELYGCHFHFNQCLFKRFKGLEGYSTQPSFKSLLNTLFALPFLPLNDVESGWELVKGRLSLYPEAQPIINYFQDTWMHGNYSPALWNCYNRTLSNIPRTNNIAEGGNNALRTTFGCSKPTLWKFIEQLKKVQSQTEFILVQHQTGRENAGRQKKKWVTRERRIVNVVSSYDSRDKLGYLRSIGHLFSH